MDIGRVNRGLQDPGRSRFVRQSLSKVTKDKKPLEFSLFLRIAFFSFLDRVLEDYDEQTFRVGLVL